MKHVITVLENALDAAVSNEPINRTYGNTDQADLEAVVAAELRQVLQILNAVQNGPIWPEPKIS